MISHGLYHRLKGFKNSVTTLYKTGLTLHTPLLSLAHVLVHWFGASQL
jgi:hypothetical protein